MLRDSLIVFTQRATLLVIAAAAMLFVTSTGQPQTPEFAPRVVIPRAFPPIKDAPMVSADEAARFLGEGELILGVVVDGKARAYPINMLTGPQREIINDTLGGRAIAATW